MRVAFINVLVNPFRLPLMREIAALDEFDITVFHSRTSYYRFWEHGEMGFPYKVLPGTDVYINDVNVKVKLHINPTLPFELVKGKYDVIIAFTWSQPGSLFAQAISRLTGIPVLLWDDTFRTKANPILMPAIKKLIRSYSGYLVGSSRCADYYASYNISRSKIFLFPNVIDNQRFSASSSRSKKHELRLLLGLPTTGTIVLYCGQLVANKGVMELLQAWTVLRDANQLKQSHLVMIGKGVLRDEIIAYIQDNNLGSSVMLQGYVQYDQLPQWFAASDLFVLLSHYDPFPLVINEALCSGLPVIATETVGAVDDLVKDGVTGLVVPPKNVDAVVGALAQLLHDDEKRQAMSMRAQQTMRVWNSDLALAGLRKAIASVTQAGKR